jgi:hypothetical protein
MRRSNLFSLGLTLLCLANCRERAPVQEEAETENSGQEAEVAATGNPGEINSLPIDIMETMNPPDEAPIAMQPQVAQRVESLSFAHSEGLCVQVNPDGQTSLQKCDPNAAGQKFLFARSLDGRVQLKDTSSQRCLSVGPIGFFVTVLRANVCESKSTQFFSVVDYGMTYSLKFDANNTCIDAEKSQAEPGTRLILFRCSAVLNQKIQLAKP